VDSACPGVRNQLLRVSKKQKKNKVPPNKSEKITVCGFLSKAVHGTLPSWKGAASFQNLNKDLHMLHHEARNMCWRSQCFSVKAKCGLCIV
jgi:hypothetical protein